MYFNASWIEPAAPIGDPVSLQNRKGFFGVLNFRA
jgi:hypothetical protein